MANAEIRQPGSAELLANAEIRHPASTELLGRAKIQHTGTPVELLAKFEVQDSEDLLGKADIRHSTYAELFSKVNICHDLHAEILTKINIRHSTITELFGRFTVRHTPTPLEIFANLIVRPAASAELLSRIEIGQDSADLRVIFIVRHEGTDELYGRLTVTRVGTPQEILGKLISRHSSYSDLLVNLYVRPEESTAIELVLGGRDRRLIMGGTDREMTVGGRDRRMRIK